MLSLYKVDKLRGEVTIPGDKSVSHRAIMFGALSQGESVITNFLGSADCYATMDCFRRLGVNIEQDEQDPGRVVVHGVGLHGLHPTTNPVQLSTQNSGTTTRILSGILAPQTFTSILSGDESVNQRPMRRVIAPLSEMGARIVSVNGNGCAPLEITGSPVHGITYESPVASAQVKSAILCAGLYADSETTVIEPTRSRDHTERMLTGCGAVVRSTYIDANGNPVTSQNTTGLRNKVTIAPCDELHAVDVVVPGDISSAAYFIAAASIVPDAEVLIRNVGTNPTRDGMLRVARAMGVDMTLRNESSAAEPAADILVRSSHLHGTVIEGDLIPTLIDELPVIAVMAAMAEGTTIIKDAHELRVKESDRIETMTEGLLAMGARVTPIEDGMIIEGTGHLHGASIRTYKDHRVAMSFAVASLVADGETILDDESCVNISYPVFFQDLESLTRR